MFPTSKFLLCGIVICFFNISVSVYLPGVAPTDYSAGEEVELKVNKIYLSERNKKISKGLKSKSKKIVNECHFQKYYATKY